MRIQRFCSVLLLASLLLMISMLTAGCYTQFATTNSIERIASPSEVDVEELVENGGSVTINNYYDSYYARFMRPTIYGFGGAWGWYDPFWDYPLWYTPVIAPIGWYGFAPIYYGWGWNRWGWNPYFPPYWGGSGIVSTQPVGTRRTGIGRTRDNGMTNTLFPTSSSLRAGSSSDGGIAPSNSRRQRESTTSTTPADASRRTNTGRSVERKSDGKSKEKDGGYSAPSRRQSSGERRAPSYSAPAQRGSSPSSAPSRGSSGSSGSSSSGSSGRRQR